MIYPVIMVDIIPIFTHAANFPKRPLAALTKRRIVVRYILYILFIL